MSTKKKVVAPTSKKSGYVAVYLSSNETDDFNTEGSDRVFFGKTVSAACKNFNAYEDPYADIEVYELVLVGKYKPKTSITFVKIT